MTYVPKAIDTTGVTLPPAIQDLAERLAENAHDVWSRKRLDEGWRYGPKRDDTAKEHPCLLPYSELPESEKEYDRATAMQTLKAMLVLGYRITR